jgi:hypothetical protein
MCAPWVTQHTFTICSCQKKKKENFFSFPVAVNSSIKVGPLVFLLQIFVIMENIMTRPVYTASTHTDLMRIVATKRF